MQVIIVAIILTVAVGYAAWRIYMALKGTSDPCFGCQGCQLKEQKQHGKQKKPDCWHKK